MSPDEIEALLEHRRLLAYAGAVLAAGLVCGSALAVSLWRSRSQTAWGKVPCPFIGWMDFGFFIWLVFLWVLASQITVARFFPPFEEMGIGLRVWWAAAAGGSMEAGMILVYWIYGNYFPSFFRRGLARPGFSWGRALPQGLYYFFASLPAAGAAGVIWSFFLNWLAERGVDVPLEPQQLVGLLQAAPLSWGWLALALLAAALAPAAEELVFRAGIYRFFKRRLGAVSAAFISSFFFSLLHQNAAGFAALLVMGLFLCLAYERTGDLRVPLFFHAAFNLNSLVLLWLRA